jgi:hypothetical protein
MRVTFNHQQIPSIIHGYADRSDYVRIRRKKFEHQSIVIAFGNGNITCHQTGERGKSE